jgi:hypothetical protein
MSILSYRNVLEGSLTAFLDASDLEGLATPSALAELVIGLSGHREEGRPLAPSVFLCDDGEALRAALGGTALLWVGVGPVEPVTVRYALKVLAPLATSGWSMVFERRGDTWRLGLVRTDDFVLSHTPLGRFNQVAPGRLRAVGVLQLTAQVVTVRASSGEARDIYLSGAPVTDAPAVMLDQLRPALTRHLVGGPEVATAVWTFYRRVLLDSLRDPHGSLLAVLRTGAAVPSELEDAALLDQPIDVAGLVRQTQAGDGDARVTLQGVSGLLLRMLGSDGVTLVRSDGAVLGFNGFLRPAGRLRVAGGARRRAWLALRELVGDKLVAALTRSQDGEAEVAVAEPGDPR